MLIGVAAVIGVGISWLLPKISKPAAAAVSGAQMMAPPAKGAVAAAQSMGPIRDYNLSGLAIEELENYPVSGGVSLAGI